MTEGSRPNARTNLRISQVVPVSANLRIPQSRRAAQREAGLIFIDDEQFRGFESVHPSLSVYRPLRQQEIQAWQRLVRVLGHELNNSLTPIKSIAGSLGSLLARPAAPRLGG
jgi:hypothetical protein